MPKTQVESSERNLKGVIHLNVYETKSELVAFYLNWSDEIKRMHIEVSSYILQTGLNGGSHLLCDR